MAGNPVKHALRAELERRVRTLWPEEHERTHLDYVADWQAQGKTLRALATTLGVSAPYLTEYLKGAYGAPTVRESLRVAREAGAFGLSEEGLEIADAATSEDVNVARLRVQTREKLAAAWNGQEFGNRAGAGITINVGSLMLEALRQPVIIPAIDSTAEIVSVTESSAYEIEEQTVNPLLSSGASEQV